MYVNVCRSKVKQLKDGFVSSGLKYLNIPSWSCLAVSQPVIPVSVENGASSARNHQQHQSGSDSTGYPHFYEGLSQREAEAV